MEIRGMDSPPNQSLLLTTSRGSGLEMPRNLMGNFFLSKKISDANGYQNIMFDRRVVRGNTHSAYVVPSVTDTARDNPAVKPLKRRVVPIRVQSKQVIFLIINSNFPKKNETDTFS